MENNSQNEKFISLPLLAEYDLETGAESVIISGKTSFLKTTFHGLNALSGVGILSTPYALSSGGWLSMILLLIIACVTFYTSLLIKRCMDFDPTIRSYPDIGHRAFGKGGRILVSVFMNLELYLVATGFLILAGDNLHNLLPEVNFEFWGLGFGGRQSFVLIVALVILPTILLKNMSILAYVSASAVLASLVIIGSIFWAATYDGIGFHKKGVLLNVGGIPTSFSLYAFCYCGHPVFPTLYTSMKNRKQFSKVTHYKLDHYMFLFLLSRPSYVQSYVALDPPNKLLPVGSPKSAYDLLEDLTCIQQLFGGSEKSRFLDGFLLISW